MALKITDLMDENNSITLEFAGGFELTFTKIKSGKDKGKLSVKKAKKVKE